MTPPIAFVVLAAGASRRLGTPKQLVPYLGTTLLVRAVAVARAARMVVSARGAACGPVVVVLGGAIDALRDEVDGPEVMVVRNPDWATGMASSVRAAVAAVDQQSPDAGAILFTVCDQPLVTSTLLTTIVQAHRDGHDLVATGYDGSVGVPALLGRRYFADLAALTGDEGARRLLNRHANTVHVIPFPDGAVDIDTPADLARLRDC